MVPGFFISHRVSYFYATLAVRCLLATKLLGKQQTIAFSKHYVKL